MNKYFENLDPQIKEYFKILSPEGIPDFLLEYIYTRNAKTKWYYCKLWD